MKKTDILLWGDLCIDRNNLQGRESFGPGGTAYFCAKVFKKFGWQPFIVSPRGKDYDDSWIESIPVFPRLPLTKNTLLYQNCYDSKGKRTLFAANRNSAFFINPLSLPREWLGNAKAVVVCPIDNNISSRQIKNLRARISPKTLFACLPQGFFRRYEAPCAKSAGYLERNSSVAEYPPSLLATGSELRKGYSPRLHLCGETAGYLAKENKKSGRVYQADWQNAKKTIPYFDMIFLSEEDGKNLNTESAKWSQCGSLVVLTKAERGCSVFKDGKRTDFAALPVKKVANPVGAGDVFAAAFIHAYLCGKNASKAAIFANATAARHVQKADFRH